MCSATSITHEGSLSRRRARGNSRGADYYDTISPGLGTAFKRELRQLLRLVVTMPLMWPTSGEHTRKCLLTRFPYLVIYAPFPDELLVLAVGHQHRRPGYWRERLADLK